MSAVSPLRTAVTVVQFFAASAALAFVVLLFVNEPDQGGDGGVEAGGAGGADGAAEVPGAVDGAAVFANSCARCHGSDGGGGSAPQLSDGEAVSKYPNIEDQIAVVTNGLGGGMPSFGGDLSPEEIRAVVEYTRTL
ncbi:MAG: c-type cytochrome [Acidimicrobiales bacterium]